MCLGNILVYSVSSNDNMDHLHTALQYMHEKYLCAKVKKCAFLQHSVDYLGHIVSDGSIKTNPDKLKAI